MSDDAYFIQTNASQKYSEQDLTQLKEISNALGDKSIFITGGPTTAEAWEPQRRFNQLDQLKLARKLRAILEQASADALSSSSVQESRLIFQRHAPYMTQLAFLTDAVLGNYFLKSYDGHHEHEHDNDNDYDYGNDNHDIHSSQLCINEHMRKLAYEKEPYRFRMEMKFEKNSTLDSTIKERIMIQAPIITRELNAVVDHKATIDPIKDKHEKDSKSHSTDNNINNTASNSPHKTSTQSPVTTSTGTSNIVHQLIQGYASSSTTNNNNNNHCTSGQNDTIQSTKDHSSHLSKRMKIQKPKSKKNSNDKKKSSNHDALRQEYSSNDDGNDEYEEEDDESFSTFSQDTHQKLKQNRQNKRIQQTSPNNGTHPTATNSRNNAPRKCHNCKSMVINFRRCHYWFANGTKCRKCFCETCCVTIYKMQDYVNEIDCHSESNDWHCPSCTGSCLCSVCVKEREREQARANLGLERRSRPLNAGGFTY